MAAPIGNQWWKLRSRHGAKKLFETPELLWEACCEYFEVTDQRKWKKKDWVGKDAIEVEREVDTPYTVSGLCIYLNCSREWWNKAYQSAKQAENDDFLRVFTHVEQIMYTQKFEGASVGAFNANIIARDLGLKEQTDITSGGEKMSPVITAMTDGQILDGELK